VLPATVAVLIVTCPCALALATPMILTIAAGRLAQIGVLPARMSGIERLGRAETAAFDKTGTLTLSAPCLAQVRATGGLDREEALKIGAALESSSTHPIARAVGAAAGDSPHAEEVAHHPGQGVAGGVGGVRWRIGSPAFALGPAQGKSDLEEAIAQARADGLLVAVLADGDGRSALFTFEETLRPGSREIVGDLRDAGIRFAVLLSGDARQPVERLARSLGFDEARGEMTAGGKLEWIRAQERSGAGVLYVGDGWNDAPTLAAAGTSVSFGEAAQLARLTSDFVILGGDLASLAAARRIARRSTRLLRQNVAWALAYNLLAVPLAAAGLVPPWAAALGMSASSLGVVANALRLRRPAPGERPGVWGTARSPANS
jgi:Cu2+-exporting ATPase